MKDCIPTWAYFVAVIWIYVVGYVAGRDSR